MSSAKRLDPRKLLGVRITLGKTLKQAEDSAAVGANSTTRDSKRAGAKLGAKVGNKQPP